MEVTYTKREFKELLDKVDALLEENDRLEKDVAYWHHESDVHFEDLCKRGEQLRDVVDKACELFRKECQEANGLIKSVCDRNIGDLINVDASVKSFRKKLEE